MIASQFVITIHLQCLHWVDYFLYILDLEYFHTVRGGPDPHLVCNDISPFFTPTEELALSFMNGSPQQTVFIVENAIETSNDIPFFAFLLHHLIRMGMVSYCEYFTQPFFILFILAVQQELSCQTSMFWVTWQQSVNVGLHLRL